MALGVSGAKKFLDRVRAVTGIVPFIYMSKSVCRGSDWSSVANDFPLWVAQYANNNPTGYQENPWTDDKGYGAWISPAIFQYSSTGRLDGFGSNLDLNIAYMTADKWQEYAGASVSPPTSVPDPSGKDLDFLAIEVLSGLYGNTEERRKALGKLYVGVQAVVNKKHDVITYDQLYAILKKEVEAGNLGNGEERKMLLGMYYNNVQALINNSYLNPSAKYHSVKSGDTMSKIAQMYNTTLESLRRLNPNVVDVNVIKVGQKIRVK